MLASSWINTSDTAIQKRHRMLCLKTYRNIQNHIFRFYLGRLNGSCNVSLNRKDIEKSSNLSGRFDKEDRWCHVNVRFAAPLQPKNANAFGLSVTSDSNWTTTINKKDTVVLPKQPSKRILFWRQRYY